MTTETGAPTYKAALAFLKREKVRRDDPDENGNLNLTSAEENAFANKTRIAQYAIDYADEKVEKWYQSHKAMGNEKIALTGRAPELWEKGGNHLDALEIPGNLTVAERRQRVERKRFIENNLNTTDLVWLKMVDTKYKKLLADGGIPSDLNTKSAIAARANKKKGGRRRKKKEEAEKGTIQQREQAFLLQNIESILKFGDAPIQQDLPRLIVVSTKDNLASTLLSSKEKLLSLMSVSPKDLSALTPYIRLYKKDTDLESGKTRVREFKLASHSPNLYDYLKEGAGAAANIGLKSFNIEMTGDNEFTSTRKMRSELVLYFQSFSELAASDSDGKTIGWQELLSTTNYQDAPVVPAGNEASTDEQKFEATAEDLERRRGQLLIEMGYNFSDAIIEDQNLREAVSASRMLLSIQPTDNEFSFNEDGSTEISIAGIAASEAFGETIEANVLELGITEASIAKLEALQKTRGATGILLSEAENKTAKKKIKTEIKKLETKIDDLRSKHNSSRYGGFIKYLYDNQRLFSFTIDEDQYREGHLPSTIQPTTINENSAAAAASEQVANAGPAGNDNQHLLPKGLDATPDAAHKRTIGYFYFGDLLNYMAYALVPIKARADFSWGDGPTAFVPDESDSAEQNNAELIEHNNVIAINNYHALAEMPQASEVIVGDFIFNIFPKETSTLTDEEWAAAAETKRENLTKLPITWSLFNTFMQEHVVKPKRGTWYFTEFLEKATTELIAAALDVGVQNRIREKDKTQKSSIIALANRPSKTMAAGHSPGLIEARINGTGANFDTEIDQDLVKTWKITKPNMDTFIGTPDGTNIESLTSFVCIGGSMLPYNRDVGKNEAVDAAVGIYHLRGGSATGIVKNMGFKQVSSRLKDIAISAALKGGSVSPLLGIFKQRYNAEVTMYGNPSFYPGQQLFLNPSIAGVGDVNVLRSTARKLGLGGLYNVQSVAIELGIGTLITTLSMQQTLIPPDSGEIEKFEDKEE